MRILILTDRYPPYYEGAYELNCQQVANGLTARGHEIVVLTSTYGVSGPVVEENGIRRLLHSIEPVYRGRVHRRMKQGLEALQRIANYRITRRVAQEVRPDLVFIWHMLAVSVMPVLAVQDLGLPTVYRIGSHWLPKLREEYVLESSALKRWYRSALMGFRGFGEVVLGPAIMVSPTLRENHAKAGFDVSQAVVIPSGIPAAWVAGEPAAIPSNGAHAVLYVGRIEKEKGVEVALEAVAHLRNNSAPVVVHLDLIGRGRQDYVDQVQALITRQRLEGQISLLGSMPRENLLARYRAYAALIFTSLHLEGLPMTLIEAMAQGVAVIASDIVGPRDIIVNGENGILVPPGDARVLAEALERVLGDPAQRLRLGQAAIATVRQHHLFDQMLDSYEAVLAAAGKCQQERIA